MRMRTHNVLGLVLVLCIIGGCNNEQLALLRSEATKTEDRLNKAKEYKAVLEAQLKASGNFTIKNKIIVGIAKVDSLLEKYEKDVVRISKAISKVEDNWDLLSVAVQGAVPFMGPYGSLAVLGAGVIIPMIRNWSNKRKAKKITRNINTVINDPSLSGGAGKFDANDPATMARMRELDEAAGVDDMVKSFL